MMQPADPPGARAWQAMGAYTLVALLFLLGCDRTDRKAAPVSVPAASSPAVTVGYSAPEWGGGQFLIMEGLRNRAQTRGWRVDVVNAEFDADVQARQIEYLVGQHVSAIVAVPLHSQKIVPIIAKARAAGIRFYTIDRAPSQGTVDMTVQADNRLAGRQAGEAMLSLLKDRYGEAKGRILELQGDLDQTVAQQRGAGFHEVIDPYPAIQVIQRQTRWQASLFAEQTTEVLKTTALDGIYLHSDMIGVPEVLPALKKLEALRPATDAKHVLVVGIDGGPPALAAIREGLMDCAISQPLTDYGIVVDWIELQLQGRQIQAGLVEQAGASWSPAQIVSTPHGFLLELRTTPVKRSNVDDAGLWGNQFDRAAHRLDEQKR